MILVLINNKNILEFVCCLTCTYVSTTRYFDQSTRSCHQHMFSTVQTWARTFVSYSFSWDKQHQNHHHKYWISNKLSKTIPAVLAAAAWPWWGSPWSSSLSFSPALAHQKVTKNRILYHLNTDLLTDPQTEADKITAAWLYDSIEPSVSELKTAAQLAQEGYLSSVRCMRVRNMNISEI